MDREKKGACQANVLGASFMQEERVPRPIGPHAPTSLPYPYVQLGSVE